MSGAHDHIYKQLFSHPELVRELLPDFIPQDWARRGAASSKYLPMTPPSSRVGMAMAPPQLLRPRPRR